MILLCIVLSAIATIIRLMAAIAIRVKEQRNQRIGLGSFDSARGGFLI